MAFCSLKRTGASCATLWGQYTVRHCFRPALQILVLFLRELYAFHVSIDICNNRGHCQLRGMHPARISIRFQKPLLKPTLLGSTLQKSTTPKFNCLYERTSLSKDKRAKLYLSRDKQQKFLSDIDIYCVLATSHLDSFSNICTKHPSGMLVSSWAT